MKKTKKQNIIVTMTHRFMVQKTKKNKRRVKIEPRSEVMDGTLIQWQACCRGSHRIVQLHCNSGKDKDKDKETTDLGLFGSVN